MPAQSIQKYYHELTDEPLHRKIACLIFNRPHVRNALTCSMLVEAREAIEDFTQDSSVRTILITGTNNGPNPSFCAGADLKTTLIEDPNLLDHLEHYIDEFHNFIRALWNAPKPVIASVDGPAVGFGCDITLACDFRILSHQAYLQESFVKIGLMPDGGATGLLPRLVGLTKAFELIMLANKIEASKALEFGLATRVVESHDLMKISLDFATQLADGPPIALAESKRALHASLGITIDEILTSEREGQLRCLRSQDAQAAIFAWTQKQKPKFNGR